MTTKQLTTGFSILPMLLLLAIPCQADIYAFVDSKGIRHISNMPDDPRYKLVMKTPVYSTPKAKTTTSGSGWQIIRPEGAKRDGWWNKPYKKKRKKSRRSFAVNEANRRRFSPHIAQIAGQHRLDPALLHAVITVESAFNPKAVSHAGAQGLMQLMPATAKRFGVHNSFDPIANMRGGARYLRLLLDQFKNLNLALAAYNAGEGAVMRYGNTIPPYKETQNYVVKVMQAYRKYRRVN